MNKLLDFFEDQLKEKGYRLTGQRKAVLSVILEHKEKHLNAEEIFKYVKEKTPGIGVATVYRTLGLFETLKIIYKIDFDDGYSRYEINKQDEDHRHHHLICTICGKVTEVEEDLLDSLEEKLLIKEKFLVKDHKVKFYGYCEKCRNKKDI